MTTIGHNVVKILFGATLAVNLLPYKNNWDQVLGVPLTHSAEWLVPSASKNPRHKDFLYLKAIKHVQ